MSGSRSKTKEEIPTIGKGGLSESGKNFVGGEMAALSLAIGVLRKAVRSSNFQSMN
jgi:hypothetical protein